jgi:hypothetical protein
MSTILSTSEERHAFAIGLCEVLCPWPPQCHCDRALSAMSAREAISQEYHYYLAGRALGVIAWLIIAKIIQELFF